MVKKNKLSAINIILIILGIIISIFSACIILLAFLKNSTIETQLKSVHELATNYTSAEETSTNTWDISENQDGSIIATYLEEDYTLNISGSGKMLEYENDSDIPWNKSEVYDKIKIVRIGEGITSLYKDAFSWCSSLYSIEIPSTIINVDGYMFKNCEDLDGIKVAENNEQYCDVDGILYTKDKTKIVKYPGGKNGYNVTVLDNVTTIGRYAFAGCYETHIDIPNNVTKIEEGAFTQSALMSINISESVTIIEERAFARNEYLKRISLPQGLTHIADFIFSECIGLRYIEIPNSVTSIGSHAFENCYWLTSIEIPEGVTTIGDGAFYNCSFANIELPSTLTNIGSNVFYYCDYLTNIEVSEDNPNYMDIDGILYSKDGTTIIRYPEGKIATEYIIPDSVTTIADYAFYNCTLSADLKIPDKVTNIGQGWDTDIIKLIDRDIKTVELPDILKRVLNEQDMLYADKINEWSTCTIEGSNIIIKDNENAAGITVNSGVVKGIKYIITYNSWDVSNSAIATLSDDGILNISGTGPIYYINNSNLDRKINKVKIEDGITEIGSYIFNELWNLTSIEIPNSVTTIGEGAFYECKALTNIEIPNSVAVIGCKAFFNCISLKSIEIPSSVKRIESYAFSKCHNLTSIEIQNGVIDLAEGAISYCPMLTEISIPESVISIGEKIFASCDRLKNIEVDENNPNYIDIDGVFYTKDGKTLIKYPPASTRTDYIIPDTVEKIGYGAFTSAVNLLSITMPNTVTSIGEGAFAVCFNLENIELPEGITEINESLFYWCRNLTSIKIPSSVTTIKENAFQACLNLKDIEIPSTVTNMEEGVFEACRDLMKLKILSTTVKLDEEIFEECHFVTIYCYENSTAETYAKENNIRYKLIDAIASDKGKVDEENKIIRNIDPDTTIRELIELIESELDYDVIDKDGNDVQDDEKVGTGYLIKLENGKIYIIIIIGDSNGDGQSNMQDIFAINKYRLNKTELDDANLKASDVNEDGKVDMKDIFRINKYRLGISETL